MEGPKMFNYYTANPFCVIFVIASNALLYDYHYIGMF